MISKNDALKRMERTDGQGKRIPFHIAFLTADRAAWAVKKRLLAELTELETQESRVKSDEGAQRIAELKDRISKLDVGGRIIEHDNCVMEGRRGMHAEKESQESRIKNQESANDKIRKNPQHWKNRTRNIVFLPSKQTRKCHISLIVSYNHEEVIY